jgi:regulator of replication initiation timing
MTKKEIEQIKFNKEQIVNSNKFTQIERDILKALLDDKGYSLEEAKNIIDEFKKREVK